MLGGEVAPKAGAGVCDVAPNGVEVLVELPPPKENIPEPELLLPLCCWLFVLVLDDCPNWKMLGVAEAGLGAVDAEPNVGAFEAPNVGGFVAPNDGG